MIIMHKIIALLTGVQSVVHSIGSRIFFFKQKTAYEMRISDWSSDVCSSDLARRQQQEEDGETVRDMRRPHRDGRRAERPCGGPPDLPRLDEIGRASCRERVCQCV